MAAVLFFRLFISYPVTDK